MIPALTTGLNSQRDRLAPVGGQVILPFAEGARQAIRRVAAGCDMLQLLTFGNAAGGSMSFREQLHAYIAQLEQRLRWSTVLRGIAILTGGALVATLVLVAIANALAFSQ